LIQLITEDWPGHKEITVRASASVIKQGLDESKATLAANGIATIFCLVDFGDTAEETFVTALRGCQFDAIVFGAGLRVSSSLLLLERLLNLAHKHAPRECSFAFNTSPNDTAAAVQRWL